MTDAGWRPEALRQVRKAIQKMYLSFKHTANGPLVTEVASLILGADPRLTVPEQSVMLSRKMEDGRELARAYLGAERAARAVVLPDSEKTP